MTKTTFAQTSFNAGFVHKCEASHVIIQLCGRKSRIPNTSKINYNEEFVITFITITKYYKFKLVVVVVVINYNNKISNNIQT